MNVSFESGTDDRGNPIKVHNTVICKVLEIKDGMIRMPDGTLVKAEVRYAEGTTDTDRAEM